MYKTAKEIWDAAKETYSNNENTSELFEIKDVLNALRQGELTVTQYFNALNRYWQPLDTFDDAKFGCPESSSNYKRIVEKEWIFKFLFGLNKNLDEVRRRVLGINPLPPIREVFSKIRREESRTKVMMENCVRQPRMKVLLLQYIMVETIYQLVRSLQKAWTYQGLLLETAREADWLETKSSN